MRTFLVLVLSCLPFSVLAAQQPPLTPITPLAVNPASVAAGTTSGLPPVISANVLGTPVQTVAQIELRPIGTTGSYRAACTVVFNAIPQPRLLTGTLDLGVTPPVWTPNGDVDGLNLAGKVHFQVSMSPDGLVVVWDIYGSGATSLQYPALPPGPHSAFVCARASTAVPFSIADVRAMFVGRPSVTFPWTDPRLGDAPPLPNGNYELFYSDSTLGGPGDILRGEVDPATGIVSGSSVFLSKPASATYYHSPCDLRDAAGRVRALTCGQTPVTGLNSDILWQRNATNTSVPYVILDGTQPLPLPSGAAPPIWFSNGATVGGSFVYGTSTSQQVDPYRVEHVLLADANVRNGETLVGYAPIRPTPGPGAPAFVSWIGISTATIPPISLSPGISGLLLIDPLAAILFGPILHDNHTGRAEFTFGPYLPPPAPWTLPMQMLTFDFLGPPPTLSNAATATF